MIACDVLISRLMAATTKAVAVFGRMFQRGFDPKASYRA